MNEIFQNKVAPPFLYVLSVLEKIESSGGSAPPPGAIRPRIKQLIGQFDVRGPDEEQFQLAKSAIVFWIDEVLMNSKWEFGNEWRNNPLEREIFGTRQRAWKFFENASRARGLDKTDALEVFALCVANGFQGVYRSQSLALDANQRTEADLQMQVGASRDNPVATALLAQSGDQSASAALQSLPPTLDEWLGSTFVELLQERVAPFSPSEPLDSTRSARPLVASQALVRWCLALAGVAALTIGLAMAGGW